MVHFLEQHDLMRKPPVDQLLMALKVYATYSDVEDNDPDMKDGIGWKTRVVLTVLESIRSFCDVRPDYMKKLRVESTVSSPWRDILTSILTSSSEISDALQDRVELLLASGPATKRTTEGFRPAPTISIEQSCPIDLDGLINTFKNLRVGEEELADRRPRMAGDKTYCSS